MVGENQRHPPVRGREIFKLYYQSGKSNADREQRPACRLSLLLLEGLGFIFFLFLSDLVPAVVAQVFKTIKEKKNSGFVLVHERSIRQFAELRAEMG